MPEEWAVIAPKATADEPKYVPGAAGITAWWGREVAFDRQAFANLPWHPDPMWVVGVRGTDAALQTLASHADAYTQSEYGLSEGDIAQYLNQRSPANRSFAEWTQRFFVR